MACGILEAVNNGLQTFATTRLADALAERMYVSYVEDQSSSASEAGQSQSLTELPALRVVLEFGGKTMAKVSAVEQHS